MADREEIKEIVEEIMEDIIDERVAEAVRDLINCGDLTLSMPEPEMDDDDWNEDGDEDDDMEEFEPEDDDMEEDDPYEGEDDDMDDHDDDMDDEDEMDAVNQPEGYEPVATDVHPTSMPDDHNWDGGDYDAGNTAPAMSDPMDWDGGDGGHPDPNVDPNYDPTDDLPSDTEPPAPDTTGTDHPAEYTKDDDK